MTLIELLFFLVSIAIGVWFAVVLHPIGGLWLAAAGLVAGFLLIPGVIVAYEKYRKWAYCGDDRMPPCSCGSTEYRVEVVGDMDFHDVCQSCGRRYHKRRDKVFVIEDDIEQPYMHLVKYRGWIRMDST